MPKKLRQRFQAYEAEVSTHLRRLFRREEKPREALTAVAKDTRKLARKVLQPEPTENHKQAIVWVKKGVAAYNLKEYEDAEQCFRRALAFDENYARAYLYLGNALYKKRHRSEAFAAWETAIDVAPRSEAAKMAQEKLDRLCKDRDQDQPFRELQEERRY